MDIPAGIDLEQLSPQQLNGLVALSIGIGVLYCFLGYRTLRFLIALTGFISAGMTAAVLTGVITDGSPAWMAGLGFFGGICGALALTFIYKLGVFVLGGLAGVLALQNLLSGATADWTPFAILGGGVASGVLALVIEAPILMCATAILGAWMIVGGAAFFFLDTPWLAESPNLLEGHELRPHFLLAWIVLSLAGAAAQFTTRKKKPNS